MKKKIIDIVLISFLPLLLVVTGKVQAQENNTQAVEALIKRVIPNEAKFFTVAFIPKKNGKDVFELESKGDKIVLRGSTGVAIASALNYYLRNYAHCDIGWNGTNLKIPSPLPKVAGKVVKETPYDYRYYLNYCTFNYSMSWWDWERWEKEIDFMALNGINFPLAVTGQNSVWQRVYQKLGFSPDELKDFFSGPAYFNWFWMGNLDGWGGPLPQSFMRKHEMLQKQILARERALGMKPILPAFTGHVPPAFKKKFPNAKLKQTHWSDFPAVSILDPSDPLFVRIGKMFLEEEIRTFGTDHYYTADTFNENTPPTSDSTYLSEVSRKVFHSMSEADPKATWIMQGWLFYFSRDFWQPTQIRALLNAIPNDRMIVLDLWTENHPVWSRTEAYYGKPWIWCMLHNFGGVQSLYGRMDEIAEGPQRDRKNPASQNLVGIGLTPEAIEQNPVMYQLLLDNVWRKEGIEINSWLKDYALRRYGRQSNLADTAWQIMYKTVYTDTNAAVSGGARSILVSRPTLNREGNRVNTKKNYNPALLLPAWKYLTDAAGALHESEGFQYDIVNLSRQVLANYADTLQQLLAKAYKNKEEAAYRSYQKQFLELLDDMDTLLSTRKEFLLGNWLEAAKKYGDNQTEKDLYERNARDLITLWGGPAARLHEYANKQWNGLIRGFYKPRWGQFFTMLDSAAGENRKPNLAAFDKNIQQWEWQWVNSHELYAASPSGDPVEMSGKMFAKYYEKIKSVYHL
ncbi:MAG: alpha-N-acetylglucosaminidase [Niabella sp.]